MKKFALRRTAVLLVCLALCVMAAASVIAADSANTTKEEVVYFSLENDGSLREGYVVNMFDLAEDGVITDYGEYTEVKNLNTESAISVQNDIISLDAPAGAVYYQGNLANAQNPWLLSFRYYLDGEEKTAEEMAGQSGNIRIEVSVRENTEYSGNYFDNLTLQITAILDTKLCNDIVAENATIAQAGSNKQITWMVLPGREEDFSITATAHDFEMPGISVAAVALQMDLDFDTSEFTNQFSELQDGIAGLHDAVGQLAGGASTLTTYSQQLTDGVQKLDTAANKLSDGSQLVADSLSELRDGAEILQQGLSGLDGSRQELTEGSAGILTALNLLDSSLQEVTVAAGDLEELAAGSTKVKAGIAGLYDGIVQLQTSLTAYNSSDVNTLCQSNATTIATLNNLLANYPPDSPEYALLAGTVALLNQNCTALTSMDALIQGVQSAVSDSVAEGQDNLYTAAQTLNQLYGNIDTGIQTLYQELSNMGNQLLELQTAVHKLATEYAKFDESLDTYTSGLAQITVGYNDLYDGLNKLSDGAGELSVGAAQLKEGTASLYNGANQLTGGQGDLTDGLNELNDGTGELRKRTSNMDQDVQTAIDDAIANLTGDDEVHSYVSSKNTNVLSVQFVMMSDGIQIEKPDTINEEEATEQSILDRFLDLFRKD